MLKVSGKAGGGVRWGVEVGVGRRGERDGEGRVVG